MLVCKMNKLTGSACNSLDYNLYRVLSLDKIQNNLWASLWEDKWINNWHGLRHQPSWPWPADGVPVRPEFPWLQRPQSLTSFTILAVRLLFSVIFFKKDVGVIYFTFCWKFTDNSCKELLKKDNYPVIFSVPI